MANDQVTIATKSSEETEKLGSALGKLLAPGNVLALYGGLGAGKTTLIRGIAVGMGIEPRAVHSPTFVLLHFYKGEKLTLCHFDAYRLDNNSSFEELGFEEFIEGENVAVIEWADQILNLLPKKRLDIYIEITGENSRLIKFQPAPGTEHLVNNLKKT